MSMMMPSAEAENSTRAVETNERGTASRSRAKGPVRVIVAMLCSVGLLISAGGGAGSSTVTAQGVNGVLIDALIDALAATQADASSRYSSSGQYIADYALQFHGYPYVWAGNTPGGFDCSGFTQYVILNTVGIDIGHSVPGQTGYGAWVDWGAWQPGDLVFFANTFRAGISHVGIYIGDGQMIHAENESTGVVISSLYSDYYAGHYYGAYRIG